MSPNNRFILLVILIVIIAINACRISEPIITVEEETTTTPQIIFLNYVIYKTTEIDNKIRLINKIIVGGKLKQTMEVENKANDLKCIQLNSDLEHLSIHFAKNPLYQELEYVDEFGQLGRKLVELDSAQINIRMQLDPRTEMVVIQGLNNNKLISTKLK